MAKPKEENNSGSAMDYAEHERTYSSFLWLCKWTVISVAALLIAMAIGFFGGFGAWSVLIFALLMAIAYFAA